MINFAIGAFAMFSFMSFLWAAVMREPFPAACFAISVAASVKFAADRIRRRRHRFSYDAEVAQEHARMMRELMIRRCYEHYKSGVVYYVCDVVVDEGTGEAVVVYRNLNSEAAWSKSVDDFTDTVATGDTRVPRFREVPAPPNYKGGSA
jgi:hypothetical protein